jgi:acyl-CoA reductase-like NAD-dependent aldehyde dehydrogenase
MDWGINMTNMLIRGRWITSSSNHYLEIRNPYNNEVIDFVPRAEKYDAEEAISAAVEAKNIMKEMPAHTRSEILEKTSLKIIEEKERLAHLLVKENGKTLKQCEFELNTTARIFKGFGEETKRIYGKVIPMDSIPNLENTISMTVRQPLGVIVSIISFNYPVEIWAHKAAAILASGNAGIFVLPPECPLTILEIAKLAIECGLPSECFQYLTGYGREFGDVLIKHPDIDAISFTGSTDTAKVINEQASTKLKRVFLELGGTDPIIVCNDADIPIAVKAVMNGRLTTAAGQMCCAAKRVIVDDLVFEEFIYELILEAKKINMGDPMSEFTDIGPLINRKAVEKVHAKVHKSIEQGATVLLGGRLGNDNFYPPTILIDVENSMPVMCEEVFGPIVPVYRAENVSDAIAIANESSFGLQASVITKNINNAYKLAMSVDAGGVIINGAPNFRPGNIPFSGWKLSGLGIESFPDTIYEFTQQKTIVLKNVLL